MINDTKSPLTLRKIKKIQFQNHPVLGSLEIDFLGMDGKLVDTIIFAGENGVGKSQIINALYSALTPHPRCACKLIIEDLDGNEVEVNYRPTNDPQVPYNIISRNHSFRASVALRPDIRGFMKEFDFHGILSNVDVVYNAGKIEHVNIGALDKDNNSRESDADLAPEINQLLVDIQAEDAQEISDYVNGIPDRNGNTIKEKPTGRMQRFKKAFDSFFGYMEYLTTRTEDREKKVIFKKYGDQVSLNDLSTGEKQIIYRGAFLLKDIEAMRGAVVFIEEPELGLHPNWQKRILDYYKAILTDENGNQTSQLFITTHSPFIIHNESRKNDKVIVLARKGEDGQKSIEDKPEYYRCDGLEAIQDAFSTDDLFRSECPIVFVEGRTDEKYLKRAAEVYKMHLPFEFRWIGHLSNNGNEEFSGEPSLNHALNFLKTLKSKTPFVLLYDCDTKKKDVDFGDIFVRCVPQYSNQYGITKGIENGLVLQEPIDENYYKNTKKDTGYGKSYFIPELKKTEFCDYICSKNDDELQMIFANLKKTMEMVLKIFERRE